MDRNLDIYRDIQTRTNGDVYIGVVGPVRCGKSTFITRFMNAFVLPNILSTNERARANDELPQSGDGKTVMTTQPKFVPSEAVAIKVKNITMRARMIDCVGFMIDGALGSSEGNKPRMVKTPWSDEKMPFNDAAALGTQKVISEHSTLAIVMTTDGSFGDIDRQSFVSAESKAVASLKTSGKPFIIVLNSAKPTSDDAKKLAKKLSSEYDAPVILVDVDKLGENDVEKIFIELVTQFPVQSIDIVTPNWMRALPCDSVIVSELLAEINIKTTNIVRIGDFKNDTMLFENSENFEPIVSNNVDIGKGSITFEILPKANLFYKVLSIQSGENISDDYELVSYVKTLSVAKRSYDKLKSALQQVKETGYGIVAPTRDEMELKDPEIIKQGNRCGLKLRASAPSLHIMRVDVEAEVSPIMGAEQQSLDMVEYLQSQFENDPKKLWSTNMFGKSLESMVSEGLVNKVHAVPNNIQNKMRKTMTRIVNEGKGGVICILL